MSAPSGIAPAPRTLRSSWRRSPALAVVRRTAMDARVRTISFVYLFAVVAYINPATYKGAYPTLQARIEFAHSFANNKAVVLFYGKAYDLLTVGGYAAWRTGGTLAIFAAIFGLFAAVRALRAEEDTGRAELVLSGIIRRLTAFGSAMAAIAAAIVALWIAEFAGLVLAGLPAGSSAFLSLATASVVPVFVGVGALMSQIAPNKRMALQLGGGIIALAFLLRVVADTSSGAGWLRWVTPLGWAEELRPFTGERPLVLLLPLAVSVILLAVAARLAVARDVGAGLIAAHDTAPPWMRLLSSPTAHALREERTSLAVWAISVAIFGLIIGIVSKSINSTVISKGLQEQLQKFGEGSIVTPLGYIAFAFIFFVLAVCLFTCAQLGAARHEESEQQLETLVALPVSRRSWLAGRLGLAAAGVIGISLVGGVSTWAGAQGAGVNLSLWKMLGAGANCLPAAALFLGLAALAYSVAPRASGAISYGLVTVAFLWFLFGSLVGVPKWVINATPFAHVAAVPVQSFRLGAAVIMVVVGVLAAVGAIAVFERRDLLGA